MLFLASAVSIVLELINTLSRALCKVKIVQKGIGPLVCSSQGIVAYGRVDASSRIHLSPI
jgi:hypothetical protein